MRRTLPSILVILLAGCTAHYKVSEDIVEHVSWNAGQGKVVKTLNGASAKSFQQLKPWYGKDELHAYWMYIEIEEADARSFEAINNYYAVDSDHGYFTQHLLENSDGKTFEYLGSNWSRDKNTYFYNRKRIDVCDYDSFKIIEATVPFRATDRSCYYYQWHTVQIKDRSSLEILPSNYAKDNYFVYWGNVRIEEAHAATFVAKGEHPVGLAKDKRFCFSGPKTIECNRLNDEGKEFCGCSAK